MIKLRVSVNGLTFATDKLSTDRSQVQQLRRLEFEKCICHKNCLLLLNTSVIYLWRSFALYFSFTMSYLTASIQQTARFRLKIDKRLISTKQLLWQWRISWEFQLKSSDEVFKFAYNDDFLFDIRNILIVARLRTINHLLVTICQSRHFSSRTIFFSKMVTRHMAFLYTLKMRTRCINHNKLVSCQFSSFQWSCVPLSQQMNRGKAVEYFPWKRRKSMWNFFSHQLGWCSRT